MIFTFVLLSGVGLPIFMNRLGTKSTDFNICLDTGCGLTTFYMDLDSVQFLYPEIKKVDTPTYIRTADGNIENNALYIIPEFRLTDKDDQTIFIRNLYCSISDVGFDNFDILLSGNAFYNAGLTITPYKDKEKPYRIIRIDTFDDGRDTFIMRQVKDVNGKIIAYPACLKEMK